MNKRLISYILGWVLVIEGLCMQLSTIVGLIYGEKSFLYFLVIGLSLIVIGALFVIKKPKNHTMHLKDGFASTSLSWIVLSLAGALPLYFSGTIENFVDAFFETVSGFTTTGATIITDIEALDRCMLFWRSFSHFLGGMGVVVFLLALIPKLGGNQSINLMKAESTGPSVGKSMPKLRTYAALLYSIYIGLAAIEFVLLLFGGMSVFDALTTAFSTAGTGGFSTYNASMGHFDSYYLQTVVAVFMMLFGINFYVYILILTGKIKQLLKMEEMWIYLSMIVLSTVAIAVNLLSYYDTFRESIHQSFFYVTSIQSSTGFAITDTNPWPEFSKILIIILTCVGACAGSTGGGFKVARVIILFKEIKKEFMLFVHPRNIYTVKTDGKKVSHEVTRNVSVYLTLYILIILVTTALISFNGFDFTTNFTSVLATLNNTGPGFSMVGSAGNYAQFSIFSKLVFCFNMLAGRLELYPLVLILIPSSWKKN
ncbi:MAG: TrkH family potassium uptake protein [Ruminococcaceae bacterium]|nr:TrkH family potassium uptake protein [Oscillospiraceae bacterium]